VTTNSGFSVIIATRGRPAILLDTLGSLSRQTLKPDEIIIVGTGQEDFPTQFPPELPIRAIIGRRGTARQRNAGLANVCDSCRVITFVDDDVELAPTYLEKIAAALESDEFVAGCGGNVLRDGAKTGGVQRKNARTIIAEAVETSSLEIQPTESLYGCNMSFRRTALRGILFDDRLPLYGWLEDLDFSIRVARRGRLVTVPSAHLVHMGVSGGRVSGLQMGFSQVANPYYLWRSKGLIRFPRLLKEFWVRGMASNCLHSVTQRADSRIDWRGRFLGNAIALKDIVLGRINPERAADLGAATPAASPGFNPAYASAAQS
jgi:GT2 family glycosyltransferase